MFLPFEGFVGSWNGDGRGSWTFHAGNVPSRDRKDCKLPLPSKKLPLIILKWTSKYLHICIYYIKIFESSRIFFSFLNCPLVTWNLILLATIRLEKDRGLIVNEWYVTTNSFSYITLSFLYHTYFSPTTSSPILVYIKNHSIFLNWLLNFIFNLQKSWFMNIDYNLKIYLIIYIFTFLINFINKKISMYIYNTDQRLVLSYINPWDLLCHSHFFKVPII